MAKLNSAWHKRRPMPPRATMDERVRWHLAHAKACGCPEMPKTVVDELKRRRGAVRGRRRV